MADNRNIVSFVRIGNEMHFVKFDPMATVKSVSAIIRSNAIRTAGGDEEAYKVAVQEGCALAIECAKTHIDEFGPFVTRFALFAMGVREDNRDATIFEARYGAPVELDAQPDFEGDFDSSEIFYAEDESPASFDIAEPEFESDSAVDEPTMALEGMVVPADIDERYLMLEDLHPTVFLLMVQEYLFGNSRQIERIANALPSVEHDLPTPKWDKSLSYPVFGDDSDLSMDWDALETRHHEPAWMVGQSEQAYEDQDFLDMSFEEVAGRWLVGGDRSVRYAKRTQVYPRVVRIDLDPEWTDEKAPAFDVTETKVELDSFLDNLGWHLPTQFEMEKQWKDFSNSLVMHEQTKLSVAYQYAMARACTLGFGKDAAIAAGKLAHKRAWATKQASQKVQLTKKEAPQGASALVELLKKLGRMPSAASWKKATDAKKTAKVEIQKTKDFPGFRLVAGKVESSNHGFYQTYVKLGLKDGNRTFLGGSCNCPTCVDDKGHEVKGNQGCYHMALLAQEAVR